jgi:ligand-binding sensor domain-containing protein
VSGLDEIAMSSRRDRLFFKGCFRCLGVITLLLSGGHSQGEAIPAPDYERVSIANHSVSKVFSFENSPIEIFRNPIFTFQDRDGQYWIAEYGGERVLRYNARTQTWTIFWDQSVKDKVGLHHETGAILPLEIRKISQSKDGKLWFSGQRAENILKGRETDVSFYDGKVWGKYEVKRDRPSRKVGLFKGVDGKLWFWSQDELKSYDGQKWSDTIVLSKRLPEPGKDNLLKSGDQQVRDKSLIIQKEQYEIFDGMQDSEGYLWICTRNGIIRYDERKNEFSKYPQIKLEAASLVYEDQQGCLWFSNAYDVVVYDKKKNSGIFHRLSEHILPSQASSINTIYQDKKGQILFGLNRGVLAYKESENKWEYFTLKELDTNEAFDSINIEQIMEDKSGKIWLTTTIGLVILNQ